MVSQNTNSFSSGYLLFFQLVSHSLFQWTLVNCILILFWQKLNWQTCCTVQKVPFSHFYTCAFLGHQIFPLLWCPVCSTGSSSCSLLPHFSHCIPTTQTQQKIYFVTSCGSLISLCHNSSPWHLKDFSLYLSAKFHTSIPLSINQS